MTTSEYENLTPRESTPSRLFSFTRIRAGATRRFFPGDGAKLHFANRDVDTLELPGVPSGYLAAGDVVTASYGGKCVFRGDVATIVEARGRGTEATQTVTCVGPWSKMQRLVYRQNWFTGKGYSYSSRLVLNETELGAAQNLNSELSEILTHASEHCGYDVGTVSVSTQILPYDECRDITVADAIKRELRFFPKAIVRFDYSSETPKIHIVKNTNATTATYVTAIPKTGREYVYNAHPITGVDLEIETTGNIEGVDYRQISHQKAGDTTAGNPDCLYATLQVRGASASTTRQSFDSKTEDIPSNLNDVSWWKARHPRLANVAENAISITSGERTPNNYPRISAATAGELEAAGLKCEVSKFTCKATITTTDDKEEDVYLTLNFLTTNAKTKKYTWVAESSSESGESVPDGLAATILAERAGTLQSERLSIRLGDTLPQLGDAIVENEGTVFLQSFDVDCGDLTADLEFGIPEYLSPEDMAALLSNFRNKRSCTSATVRKTGKPSDKEGPEVELGAIPPLSSSEFAPGTKAKTTIGSSGNGSIVLDSSSVDKGKTIGVHKLTVKSSKEGEGDKQYQILSESDITIENEEKEDEENEEEEEVVKSLNGETGALTIIGGENIEVTVSGKTITISYKEGKEPDEDPNAEEEANPCVHPGSDENGNDGEGGILSDLGDANASEYDSTSDVTGGVEADGDEHPGNPCNNCD